VRGADVVVVGGGVIGCACARELARRGLGVTLVERESLAAGASGRNHGLLLTPTDPALVPMTKHSSAVYEEIAADPPIPLRLEREATGILIVATEEESREYAAAEAEAARRCGVPVERLDTAALRQAEPELAGDLEEAWLLDDARIVDPASLTVALALQASEAGAEILRHLPVRALLVEGDGVRGVVTDEGTIEAGTVVVAAGPWSDRLLRPLGIAFPITPARGWLVHLGPVAGLLRHVVEGAGWHALPGVDPMPPVLAGEVANGSAAPLLGSLLQQNPDGTVLAGSSRQAAYASEPEDPSVPREILRRAIRLVPALEEVRVLSSWWGIRPMTPDGLPIVGTVRKGLVVATGHGSFGVVLAAGTGSLVASLVTGKEPPLDPSPFDPGRFANT
jgi:glycine/D-amino acid oxidase-like deaminating enzyme